MLDNFGSYPKSLLQSELRLYVFLCLLILFLNTSKKNNLPKLFTLEAQLLLYRLKKKPQTFKTFNLKKYTYKSWLCNAHSWHNQSCKKPPFFPINKIASKGSFTTYKTWHLLTYGWHSWRRNKPLDFLNSESQGENSSLIKSTEFLSWTC